ncbi:hypothetical protein HPB50_005379 [Hyalomma asiaticum]|uniref:Uncharacterized protein n=1 Tax=Hyalomma asiaticum TaxID=266040 RepID=A0ACB7RMV5_HYAAI|nr:hypothetical protein HPB50_005379 [Hyalomma asiaticum]
MQDLGKGSLSMRVPSITYRDPPDQVPRRLTRCPEKFHGCSHDLTSCGMNMCGVTCSCAQNCRVNGDCCWDVPFPTQTPEMSKASCIGVRVSPTSTIHVHMVAGCPTTWPIDYVRDACERSKLFEDIFYVIPATTVTGVTYRNGFCALCNNDIANASFWSIAPHNMNRSAYILPPTFTQSYQSLYLMRPCNENATVDSCSEKVPEIISQKCKMYYAPVRDAKNPHAPSFKNVYCALCNSVNMSRLSCSPIVYVPKTKRQETRYPYQSGLLKKVHRTPACYAYYNGHCYVRRSRKVLNTQYSDAQEDTAAIGAPVKLQHSPSRYRSDWQNSYSLQNCIALVCTALSIVFLVFKLIVFFVFKEARNSSSKCTACLAGTLLAAQVLFLITKCADLEEDVCFAGAVFCHYCFLSTFMWTCALSFDIWKSLTTVQMSSTSGNTLALYSFLAWGAPLFVVSGALAVDQTAPKSVLSPNYGDPICFIGSFWGLVVYFFLPMASLVLFCLILYFNTVCYIRTTSSAAECANDVTRSGCRDSPKGGQQKTNLALFVRLSLVMGVPWAVTLVGSFVSSRRTTPSTSTRGSAQKASTPLDKGGPRSPKGTGSPQPTGPSKLPEGQPLVPTTAPTAAASSKPAKPGRPSLKPAGGLPLKLSPLRYGAVQKPGYTSPRKSVTPDVRSGSSSPAPKAPPAVPGTLAEPGVVAQTQGTAKRRNTMRKPVSPLSPGSPPNVPASPKLASSPVRQDSVSADEPARRVGGVYPPADPNSPEVEAAKRERRSSKFQPASPKPELGSPTMTSPGSMSPMSPGTQSPMPSEQRRPTISLKDPRLRHFWRSLRSHLRRQKQAASPGEMSPISSAPKRSPKLSMVEAAAAAAGFPARRRMQPNAGKRRSGSASPATASPRQVKA